MQSRSDDSLFITRDIDKFCVNVSPPYISEELKKDTSKSEDIIINCNCFGKVYYKSNNSLSLHFILGPSAIQLFTSF